MIRYEMYKSLKTKTVLAALFQVFGVMVFSVLLYGGFDYNLTEFMSAAKIADVISISEKDGELLHCFEGYEHNKSVASNYAGIVDDAFLENLHTDINASSYADIGDGNKLYNSTYRFFDYAFNLSSDNPLTYDDIWGDFDGQIKYGFTGDWDAYGSLIQNLFLAVSVFAMAFAAPLFTYDKECGMMRLLGAAEYGAGCLLKHKAKAAFIAVNLLLLALLAIISVIHFTRYGFANADVSIQCCFERRYIFSDLNCTMGQLAVIRILFGIIGCNTILALTMFVSMLSKNTLAAFAISLAATWSLSYPVMRIIGNDFILNFIMYAIPINALYANYIFREVATWQAVWSIFTLRIIIFTALMYITATVWKKKYFEITMEVA